MSIRWSCLVRRVPTLGLLTLLFTALPGATSAQGQGTRPLFVAIPDRFPDVGARAVVVRETAREVVLLRADDATAETLDVALSLLRRIRARRVEPGRAVVIPITGFAVTRPMSAETHARLDEALARLAAQPTARIGNLGPGRSIRYHEAR